MAKIVCTQVTSAGKDKALKTNNGNLEKKAQQKKTSSKNSFFFSRKRRLLLCLEKMHFLLEPEQRRRQGSSSEGCCKAWQARLANCYQRNSRRLSCNVAFCLTQTKPDNLPMPDFLILLSLKFAQKCSSFNNSRLRAKRVSFLYSSFLLLVL